MCLACAVFFLGLWALCSALLYVRWEATRQERLEDWARLAITTEPPLRDPMVSPLQRSEYLGRPTLLILSPIQSRLETTLGYLVLRVDLRELESLLGTPPGAAAPAFWLLDDQGRVLVRAGRVAETPGQTAFPGPLPPAGSEAGLGLADGRSRPGWFDPPAIRTLLPDAFGYWP